MNDALASPLTAFDAIVVTVVILSALMALARGFLRELATLGAFIAAIAAAYYARLYFRDDLAGLLGDGPVWVADTITLAVAFLGVYVVIAWLGARLSKNIQGLEGVGLIDRVAGLGFGVARGLVAMVFAVLLITQAVDADDVPAWIAEARLFPYLSGGADALRGAAPGIAGQVEQANVDANDT